MLRLSLAASCFKRMAADNRMARHQPQQHQIPLLRVPLLFTFCALIWLVQHEKYFYYKAPYSDLSFKTIANFSYHATISPSGGIV